MSDRIRFLRTTSLFEGVPDAELVRLLPDLVEIRAAAGETLFAAGEPGDAIYLIERGCLHLVSKGIVLLARNQGDCVGEYSLVDDRPRSAGAVAVTDTTLLSWRRDSFQKAVRESPLLAQGVFRVLTRKLREGVDIHADYAVEQQRWRQDLERAREIQVGMWPKGNLQTDRLVAAGSSHPANSIGGDYFDYLPLTGGGIAVVISGVTGHGFYSALFVAMAKSCLHTQMRFDSSPAPVMHALRRALALSIGPVILMSCCYAVIEARPGVLRYANAGHSGGCHYVAARGTVEWLPAMNPILGVLSVEDEKFAEKSTSWGAGDVLVLFSDALVETHNADKVMFGFERVQNTLLRVSHKPAPEIRQWILEDLLAHAGRTAVEDDLTVVVIKAAV